jgi:hypothetical protein
MRAKVEGNLDKLAKFYCHFSTCIMQFHWAAYFEVFLTK